MSRRNLGGPAGLAGVMLFASVAAAAAPVPGDSIRAPEAAPPATAAAERVFPVVLEADTVVIIRERLGFLSPQVRAGAIQERVRKLAGDPFYQRANLRIVEQEGNSGIVHGEDLILAVTEADARAEGLTRAELADRRLAAVAAAIDRYRSVHGRDAILRGLLLAVLTTAVLVALLTLTGRFFPRLRTWVLVRLGRRRRALRVQSVQILSARRLLHATGYALDLARWIAVALMVVAYFVLLFSFFPWTRPIVFALSGYLVKPIRTVAAGILVAVPKIIFIAVILFLTRLGLRVTERVFAAVSDRRIILPGLEPEWAATVFKLLRFVVLILVFVVVFPYIPGSASPAFKGISIFLGALLSLGSSATMGNLLNGLVLMNMRPFRVGDRVQIGGTVGDVVEMSLLVTRLRTIKNVEVTVPNSQVLANHLHNYTAHAATDGLILHTSVTIGYDVPWRTVQSLLIDAARTVPDILADPAPFVLQRGLNDFYVEYELNAYTREAGVMAATYSKLHAAIQDQFNAAGVEILSPHWAQLRDGTRPTYPWPEGDQPAEGRGFQVDVRDRPDGR